MVCQSLIRMLTIACLQWHIHFSCPHWWVPKFSACGAVGSSIRSLGKLTGNFSSIQNTHNILDDIKGDLRSWRTRCWPSVPVAAQLAACPSPSPLSACIATPPYQADRSHLSSVYGGSTSLVSPRLLLLYHGSFRTNIRSGYIHTRSRLKSWSSLGAAIPR